MMKHARAASLAFTATVVGSWGGPVQACSSEPYMGSLCVMAWTRNGSFGNGAYLPANGQLLAVNSNTALFSLLGVTYGGDGRTNFKLPDLRGRTVIGAGQYSGAGSATNYVVGQASGTNTVVLTAAQLPVHLHTLGTAVNRVVVTTTLGNMAAATTLSNLNATTSMQGVTATAAGSGLTLNSSAGGNFGSNPSNASLGNYTGTVRIYSDAAPTVAMKSGSIGGTATVSFNGNPSTTISGTPSTTLSGTPGVTVGGNTDATGINNPVLSTISPYLVMTYYIAAQGLYPTPD